jgi:2-C-methyl-D-erythritol 2,4-cyclodiphosphate synthase
MGRYFPDTDSRWKDADSSVFLKEVRRLLQAKNLKIENIDSNILLEAPKLSPHLDRITRNLSELLGIPPERINVKAKRGEGLDAVGRGEAIAAQAIVLLS